MPVELALLGVRFLFGSARGGGDSPLFTRLLILKCAVGCSPSTGGEGSGPSSFTRVTLSGESPKVLASPLGFTLAGVLTLLLFRFLEFLALAAFHLAFIFIMPTFAAISARYRAAEMVLVLHLLTFFTSLLVLQLQHASTLAITVGRVAGSTLIVRRATVEKITGPFTLRGGGSPSHVSTVHHGPS